MTYNGWSNYESWAVGLWLDNEEGSYNTMREMAREAQRTETGREPRFVLADRIKNFVQEQAPALNASLYLDLLQAALSEVNWVEVAEHYLGDEAHDHTRY